MEPQKDVVRFMQFLRKEKGFKYEGKRLLDVGCGTGRNVLYAQQLGCIASGFDISRTAITYGKDFASKQGVSLDVSVASMGEVWNIESNSVDILFDITSSNSLTEKERDIYIHEAQRVVVAGGYLFVKALCKDGDLNAKELLKRFPGEEHDTYILPEQGIVERVWTKKDIVEYYSRFFTVLSCEIKESYTTMNNRTYKRKFFLLYLQK